MCFQEKGFFFKIGAECLPVQTSLVVFGAFPVAYLEHPGKVQGVPKAAHGRNSRYGQRIWTKVKLSKLNPLASLQLFHYLLFAPSHLYVKDNRTAKKILLKYIGLTRVSCTKIPLVDLTAENVQDMIVFRRLIS